MRFPDLSLAFRNIFRRPGFAMVAILLLALGAGANAAVFSRGPRRAAAGRWPSRNRIAWSPSARTSSSPTRRSTIGASRTRSFEQIAAMSPGWMMGLVADGGEPIKVTGGRVSDNMFQALGASRGARTRPSSLATRAPARRRSPSCRDELWRSRFNGDRRIIGRSIQLDGTPHTIVGVMPRGFEIFEPGTDLWTAAAVGSRQTGTTRRRSRSALRGSRPASRSTPPPAS